MTTESLVARYLRLLAEWQQARHAAPQGGLTEAEESEWTSNADALWSAMTEAERNEVDPQ